MLKPLTNRLTFSPEVAASSLMFAAEVIGLWQAGKRVVMENSGITVDGKIWKQFSHTSSAGITHESNTFKLQDRKWVVGFDGLETQFKDSVGLKYIHLLLQ